MEISGSSAFYSGLSTIQAGQSRVDQAAGKIASAATSQWKSLVAVRFTRD